MPQRLTRIPLRNERSLRDRLRAFQQREFSLRETLDREFRQYFESFRQELERYFFEHFVVPFPRRDDRVPTWDTSIATALGAAQDLSTLFAEGLDEVQDEAEETLDDDLSDAYALGYEQGLWELYLLGEDTALDAAQAGDPDEVLATILASGIDGASYRDRLRAWTGVGRSQITQALATSTAAGYTLPETLSLVSAAMNNTLGGVMGLGSNELFLALGLGTAAAFTQFGYLEVWVTAADELVCPVCAPKHLTVTTEQPIRDTHPGCRCEKIPLAQARSRQTYVPFSDFAARRT